MQLIEYFSLLSKACQDHVRFEPERDVIFPARLFDLAHLAETAYIAMLKA